MSKGMYADDLFRGLGATTVDSLDASDFEGATTTHDLNEHLPDEWVGRYTAVVDGGSLEHVFDVRTALANVMRLVAPGGHLLMVNPTDRCIGHGFYQFGPDFYYRALSKENGFEMRRLLISDKGLRQQWYDVADPALGRLPRFQARGVAYACALARRVDDGDAVKIAPQQSYYASAWANPAAGGGLRARAAKVLAAAPLPVRQAVSLGQAKSQRYSSSYRSAYRRVTLV